uniref:Uncharacterized protein n=1 Tax=Meloidogyne enterolobii TaxID=390850 RepID=A0A6V7VV09_MELEN|nr:unnamed protein product [Meloidogyne enterolobii]
MAGKNVREVNVQLYQLLQYLQIHQKIALPQYKTKIKFLKNYQQKVLL